MTTLSSAGWIVHDVGLATAIGGAMFGKLALEPALDEVANPRERDQASDDAWRRFSWLNLAGHVAFTVPWLIGRQMLTGSEVSSRARALTRTKDVLVGASLLTGITTIVLGRMLGKQARQGRGPAQVRESRAVEHKAEHKVMKLEKAVGLLGTLDLISTAAVAAVTTLLAMEGSQSVRFAAKSRWLP